MSGLFARRVAHCAAPTRLRVASPRRFLSSDNWESKWVAATDGLKVREMKSLPGPMVFCCAHHDAQLAYCLFSNAQLRPRPTQEARGLSQLLISWPNKSRKRDLKWSTSSPGYRGYQPSKLLNSTAECIRTSTCMYDVAAKCMHASSKAQHVQLRGCCSGLCSAAVPTCAAV